MDQIVEEGGSLEFFEQIATEKHASIVSEVEELTPYEEMCLDYDRKWKNPPFYGGVPALSAKVKTDGGKEQWVGCHPVEGGIQTNMWPSTFYRADQVLDHKIVFPM